jgi:hypothetical protein
MSGRFNVYSGLTLGGALLLIAGGFLPIASAFGGTQNITFFEKGNNGIIVAATLILICAPVLVFGNYKPLIFAVLVITGLLMTDFLDMAFHIAGDNTGLVDMKFWGWVFLFAGDALLIVAAFMALIDMPLGAASDSAHTIDIPNP